MYLILSILNLMLSYTLFKRVAGSLKIKSLNMISWIFYFPLIIQSFIASVLIVSYADNHYLISKLQHDNIRFYGWAAVQYVMLALPIGMHIAMFLFGKKNNKYLFNDFITKPITPSISSKDSFIRTGLYILSFIGVDSILYRYAVLPKIPILYL